MRSIKVLLGCVKVSTKMQLLVLLASAALVSAADSFQKQAKLEMTSGKYAEAVISFSKAIDQEQDDYLLYYQRATCYMILNKRNEALKDFSKVLELDKGKDNQMVHDC